MWRPIATNTKKLLGTCAKWENFLDHPEFGGRIVSFGSYISVGRAEGRLSAVGDQWLALFFL